MQQTIIIADDHPITLNGIVQFAKELGYNVLGSYTNGISALNNILALKPNYVISDISMPDFTGLELLEKVRQQNKTVKFILYTMYHEKTLFEKAKSLGVNGYILKEFALDELKNCLETLHTKEQWFSPKLTDILTIKDTDTAQQKILNLTAAERKILSLIAIEKSSKQIAELLYISEKTVENHRSSIIKKLGLNDHKGSLAVWAVQYGKSILSAG